ncbi:MAG: hypothetical protein LHW56_10410 [Candidatus Cloacimonetes bacterium]|jgi:thiol-disulfide isomerase/thioredoxin|nr:hypothetical protein [Candidatus Cloacimonadota bacterium]MDY0173304.1 hypothetical protein [Candidatus Cloacimonadaceae bacterium]
MKYLSTVLILLSLLLVSCDRFEHKFTTAPGQDLNTLFFSPLQGAFNSITASDISAVSDFYKEDYIHNGVNKSERLTWIQSFLSGNSGVTYTISEVSTSLTDEHNAQANWRLTVSAANTKEVLADSLFMGEKLVKVNAKWLLYGNQACVPDIAKQLVIAEYFTFRTCPSCPPAEAKLQQLQNQYPENFIYLEHHTIMELAVPGDQTPAYYGAYSAPVAVFQGMEKVGQSGATSLSQYQAIVDNLVQVDVPIYYSLRDVNVNGNEVSANVDLSLLMELQKSDLVLNAVIITDEVGYQNVAGQPLHNVVRGKSSKSLAEGNFGEGINIAVTAVDPLPQNFKLIVFAQHKPSIFTNSSTIYGGIVYPISLRK